MTVSGHGNDRDESSAANEQPSALVINPDPFRTRAKAMLDDENGKVRALAQVVVTMCDNYDDLRAVYGLEGGMYVRRGDLPW